jgi:hypothetical protein
MENTIFKLTSDYECLQDMMLSDPENDNFEMIEDTLESIGDAFEVKAENAGFVIKNLTAQAQAKRDVAKQLIAEAQLIEKRAYRLQKSIENGMKIMGLKKLSGVVNTYKFRPSKKVVVDKIEDVPDELCAIEVKPNLNKIKKLMDEEGTEEFDYAHIEHTDSFSLQGVKFSETAKKAVKNGN